MFLIIFTKNDPAFLRVIVLETKNTFMTAQSLGGGTQTWIHYVSSPRSPKVQSIELIQMTKLRAKELIYATKFMDNSADLRIKT